LPAVLALTVVGVGLQAMPAVATPEPVSTGCTVYWTGDADTTWEHAANWSDHADSDGSDAHDAPGTADTACMATSPTTREIEARGPVSVGSLLFGADDHLIFDTSVEINAAAISTVGMLHAFGSMTTAAGSTLEVLSYLSAYGPLVANGTVDLHGYSALLDDVRGDVHILGTGRLYLDEAVPQPVSGLVNDSTLIVNRPGSIVPFADQTGPTILNNGTLLTNMGGPGQGTLEQVDNQGLIRSAGGSLRLPGLANLADGVLAGPGTFDATGGTISFTQVLRENRATLRLGPGGSFNGGFGDLTSNSGTLDLGVYTDVGDGLVNSGTVKVDVGVAAHGYSQTAGSTIGSGTLYGDVTIDGGSIGGGLDVMGDLTLGSGATTKMHLDAAGDPDPITVTGALRVAGVLEVDAAAGAPYAHTSQVLSTLAVRSGTFDEVTSDQDDRTYTPVYDDSSVSVTSRPSRQLASVTGGPVGQGASNQLLTLHGDGLAGLTGVTFGRPGLVMVPGSLQLVDGSSWTLRVKAASTMRTGPISVTVVTPHGDVSCADCLSVVSRPAPTADAPLMLGAGASHQSVTVRGTGFVEGAAVTIAGAVVHATSVVSPTELRVTVSVSANRAPGAASLRVTNPDGGSSVCRTCASFVAAPTLDGTNALAVRRGTEQTVHLTGTGFVDGLTLTGPAGVTFSDLVVSPTGITATMAVASSTPIASGRRVTVTTPASAGWGTVSGNILTVCTKTSPTCG
jgi:hypothetical protein